VVFFNKYDHVKMLLQEFTYKEAENYYSMQKEEYTILFSKE